MVASLLAGWIDGYKFPTKTVINTGVVSQLDKRTPLNAQTAITKPAESVNECNSNPCHNGAACVNWYNAYLCLCSAGYKGKQCQTGTCGITPPTIQPPPTPFPPPPLY